MRKIPSGALRSTFPHFQPESQNETSGQSPQSHWLSAVEAD